MDLPFWNITAFMAVCLGALVLLAFGLALAEREAKPPRTKVRE